MNFIGVLGHHETALALSPADGRFCLLHSGWNHVGASTAGLFHAYIRLQAQLGNVEMFYCLSVPRKKARGGF